MLGITRPKGGVWVEEWKRLETAVQVGREGGRRKGGGGGGEEGREGG